MKFNVKFNYVCSNSILELNVCRLSTSKLWLFQTLNDAIFKITTVLDGVVAEISTLLFNGTSYNAGNNTASTTYYPKNSGNNLNVTITIENKILFNNIKKI